MARELGCLGTGVWRSHRARKTKGLERVSKTKGGG